MEPKNDDVEAILKSMVQRENDLRRIPQMQKEMEVAETKPDQDWIDIAVKIQKQVITEFQALYPHLNLTIVDLRRAAKRYPEIAFWVKYNRAKKGSLSVGDNAPNLVLYDTHLEQDTTLFNDNEISSAKPIVIVAGSLS